MPIVPIVPIGPIVPILLPAAERFVPCVSSPVPCQLVRTCEPGKTTRSITIIDLDDNHSEGDVVLNQNIELNCSNLALSDSQKSA